MLFTKSPAQKLEALQEVFSSAKRAADTLAVELSTEASDLYSRLTEVKAVRDRATAFSQKLEQLL